MTEKTYRISGKIVDVKGRAGIPGLRVEAWDRDLIFDDLVGSAFADGQGVFQMTFDESYFREIFVDRRPDLYFKVFRDKKLLKNTKDSTWWNAPQGNVSITIEIDSSHEGQPGDPVYRVHGTVRDSNSEPVQHIIVQAFDRDLRKEPQPLGMAKTDANGAYRIDYHHADFQLGDSPLRRAPWLIVEVREKPEGNVLVSQEQPRAEPIQYIELKLPSAAAELSEWEQIAQIVAPLLIQQGSAGADLQPWELEDADIDFIVRDTQIDREQLRLWVTGARMSREVVLVPPGNGIGADNEEWILFYGWFRDGQPQDFSALLRLGSSTLLSSLERAMKQRYIPGVMDDQTRTYLQSAIDARQISEALKPAPDGKSASLGDLLSTIPGDWLDDNQRKKVAVLLNRVSHESDDFLENAKAAGLNEKQALQVSQTLQLGDLTLKHVPIIKALQTVVEKDADGTLSSLAAIQPGQWLELAFEHGAPAQTFMTPEQYAEHLDVIVESKVPTATLLAKLENQAIKFEPEVFTDVQAVLIKYPQFDIATADIDQFVIDAEIKPETTSALATLQHLKRLDARWDEVEVLVNNGLDSAAEITNYGKDQFKKILGKNVPEARLEAIHDQATALKAVSIGLMGYLQPMFYGVSAEVMGTQKNLAAAKDKIDSSPTLRKLFGALEQCHCDPCLSVLSPAAYLTDLLNFVKSSHEADFELRRRRPDIYDLELSCDNSKIELPHIDLAIEILENAVAFPYNVPLSVGTDIKKELVEGEAVGNSVRQALEITAADKLGELIAQADSWSLKTSDKKLGTTYWVVKDQYRTWYLETREKFFGLVDPIVSPINSNKLDSVIAELHKNRIPLGLIKRLYGALEASVSSDIPLNVTEASITDPAKIHSSFAKQWGIGFTVAGKVQIVLGSNVGGITLTSADGNKTLTNQYQTGQFDLLKEVGRRLSVGKMPTLLIQLLIGRKIFSKQEVFEGFVVKTLSTGNNRWEYEYHYTGTRSLAYNPAKIQVLGISYQSTASDRDLFTRSQNRNPLAYKKLSASDACFPWSLPYDLPLAESRETLRVAGVSRLLLLEQTTGIKDRYTSTQIAGERLALSADEWKLIVKTSVEANGQTKAEFWKFWGVTNTTQTIKDSFIDQDITATPFGKDGLLTRVSIILQQARLSYSELQQLLETGYIDPNGAIKIQPDNVCQPSEMRLSVVEENSLAPVLDRLHRFVRLWRATGWKIWELDISIIGICKGNIDSSNSLIQIANLGLLKYRLSLPIDVLVAMLSGFSNKRYSVPVKSEFHELTPLYDRLFQNRQLIDPPDTELDFNKIDNSSSTLSAKSTLIAASLGIRPNDLLELLSKSAINAPNPGKQGTVSRQNLQWLFRNVTLAKVLRLSLPDYERVGRLFGAKYPASPDASPDASPETLLGLLDEIDFVHQSGFSWSELEYLFLATEPNQPEHGLSTQRTIELLSALQRELRQLKVPDKTKTTTSFRITEKQLKQPLMPEVPNSDDIRWKHWNLKPIAGSSNWSVPDLSDSSKNIAGMPLDLLKRVDVLAQQARLTTDDLKLVLKTMYVDPAELQVLEIKSTEGLETIPNLTADHLDRLKRFMVLLRAAKLSPNELDFLLQAFCKTSSTATDPLKWDLNKLIKSGQAVVTLSDQLRFPLDIITGWWINDNGVDQNKLAESLGFGATEFAQLLIAFEYVKATDPFVTPSNLLELVEFGQAVKTLSNRFQLTLATVTGWWVNSNDVDQVVLAESLGVDKKDLSRLLATFEAEKTINPLASPERLLEFVDASTFLKQRIELITQHLAQAVSLEPSFVSTMLWDYLHTSDTNPKSAMQYLISAPFLQHLIPAKYNDLKGKLDPVNLIESNEYIILVRLHKTALLSAQWKINLKELTWSNARGTPQSERFAGLVFDWLPPSQTQLQTLLTSWKRSTKLYQVAHSSPEMAKVVVAYLESYQQADINKEIEDASKSLTDSFGLSDGTVATCASNLNISANPEYLDPLRFDELIQLLGTVQRLGIDGSNLESLVADPPGLATADLGRKLLRARFGESGWEKALKEISDALRIQQRDRLVEYLLDKEGLRDANSLYEHYLIDVEMSPCMNTTRMLQSTAAVQLFVQRCLFNLEKRVSPESIARNRWEWIQNYRVWEANRKVFLYPENWLFPDVRDDKSEAFRAFDKSIHSNELNGTIANQHVVDYLHSVREHSGMVVRGMYEYQSNIINNIQKKLLIIGRLPNEPYSYFWRECVSFGEIGMRWGSWQRINADVSGEYVIPFVLEEKPFLAWPTISQKSDKNDEKKTNWHITFKWVSLKGTRDGDIRQSATALTAPLVKDKDLATSFTFAVQRSNDIGRKAYSNESALMPGVIISCFCVPPQQKVDYGNVDNIEPVWSGIDSRKLPENSPAEAFLVLEVKLRIAYLDGTMPRSNQTVQLKLESVIDDYIGQEYSISNRSGSETTNAEGWCKITLDLKTEYSQYLVSLNTYRFKMKLLLPDNIQHEFYVLSENIANENSRFLDSDKPREFSIKYFCYSYKQENSNQPVSPVLVNQRTSMRFFGNITIYGNGYEATTIQDDIYKTFPSLNLPNPLQGYKFAGGNRINDGDNKVVLSPRAGQATWEFRPQPSLSGINRFVVRAGSDFTSDVFIDPTNTWHYSDSNSRYYLSFLSSLRRWLVISESPSVANNLSKYDKDELIEIQQADDRLPSLRRGRLFNDYKPACSPGNIPDHSDYGSVTIRGVHFTSFSPEAIYNWEIFYHIPIAVATFLSRQHRFEDARRWFHFIFDPTTNDASTGRERFWRFLPFRNAQVPDTITQLLEVLAGKPASDEAKKYIQDQVAAWLEDPFNPFAIARLRPSAFEWYTVIAYIKNLIAWADQLFRRDTRESINEATLLYIMAAQILGPRPEKIRVRKGNQQSLSYRSLIALKGDLDGFSNAWLSLADSPFIKAWIEFLKWLAQHGINPQSAWDQLEQLSSTGSLYFCVPPNEKLPELWDMVDDRLFKIRHCQNIEGVRRELALYEPPIDPELLIRAKAAGLDLADVLSDRFAPLPHYRFQVLLQKANEFNNEVKNLGGAILSAIEKKEAEHLALLRSSQEIDMLKLIESVKEEQIKEAKANIEALNKTRNNALDRFVYLQHQLGKDDQLTFDATGSPIVEQSLMTQVQETGMPEDFRSLSLIQSEIDQIGWLQASNDWALVSSGIRVLAGTLHAAGVWPVSKGPSEALGFAASAASDAISMLATNAAYQGGRSGMLASWQRRRDEWVQQSKMTTEEIRQIDKQIIALEIRKSIAGKELDNHRKQIEHASNIDDYMRHMKFSGESLYSWMESQIAGVYFSAYQMAYDLAKKAERAYQFELGEPSSSFVQFGHWDNLRKGLLSGERLSQNLRRMEVAHLERNRRELEITKHISLRQLDPAALLKLRATGECEFTLPEWLFDLDFPGHYFRRIKTVSVSLPCVVGPYTSVSGTLTLLRSEVRDKPARAQSGSDDPNKTVSHLPIQSIATSTAQNDAGLFELNFRDERYLPFEGAGAESTWSFRLPSDFPAFDYRTISDLVLHVRYTARDGGETLRDRARVALENWAAQEDGGFLHVLSVTQDFAEQLAAQHASDPVELQVTDALRPYRCRVGFMMDDTATLWTTHPFKEVPKTATDAGAFSFDKNEIKAGLDPHLIMRFTHSPNS